MESLLPPLQGSAVSTPNLSLTTFMDQQGDQLKQYVDESIKMHLRAYEKSAAPNFPSRESNTEPPASNTSAINGSPLTQPLYGMPMHAFVSPSQPQPLGTQHVLDAAGPSEHHLRQSGYTADRLAFFAGPSDPMQARTQNAQVASYMAGPSTPNNSAPLRTVRYITPAVRICCGPSAILRRTVRIWHEPTDVLCQTIRLYTSPRADCPSRTIYDRSVRVQPWTIRPDCGPSSSLRQVVWVRDYPCSTIYGWTIWIYLRTIWPGRGPSGLLRRTVRICVRRAESCAIRTVSTFIAATLWCPSSNTLQSCHTTSWT
jgi:hypothetical protein